jgi:hypothetical protein
MVAVAETPGAPDVGDNAPFATVKAPLAAPVPYFATKASVDPALAVWNAPVVAGKFVEAVLPAT